MISASIKRYPALWLVCLTALLLLASTGAAADERLHGVWYTVPKGDEPKVENAEIIEIIPADGPMLNVFPKSAGRLEVVEVPDFEIANGVLTVSSPDEEPSSYPYRFPDLNRVVYQGKGKEYVYYRLREDDSLLSSLIQLVRTGEVVSAKPLKEADRFGATGAYIVYLDEAKVSIWLLRFEGTDLSGGITREQENWAIPISADTVAIATGDSRSLDRFQRLIAEAFPELRR